MNKKQTKANTLTTKPETSIWDHVREANNGDWNALQVVKRELSGEKSQEMIETVGNLAWQLERATLEAMLCEQEGAKSIVTEKLKQMRLDLGFESGTALERLLIERVVQTWLYLHWLETVDAQARERPLALEKHAMLRIDRAERRHLRAIRALATIRKLSVSVQIELSSRHTVEEGNGTAII